MKLRITSITATEFGELIAGVTTRLESNLRPFVEPNDYGGNIDQFAVFFVSVDSDLLQNERYCIPHNRASRYKDFMTGKSVRFVGLAVPVEPALVLQTTQSALAKLLQSLMVEELENPPYAMPKSFDRPRLLADVRNGLRCE